MSDLASTPECTHVVSSEDTDAFLARLGLDRQALIGAVERGHIAAGNATRFHPVTAAGLMRWIETVGALREHLVMFGGWVVSDADNRPTIKNTELEIEIAVTGGTSPTGSGHAEAFPQAARRKGKATEEACQHQQVLFPRPLPTSDRWVGRISDGVRAGAWYLLYHWDGESVRMELSHPTGCTNGQFDGWTTRVPLPAWQPDDKYWNASDVGGGDVDFKVA